MKSFALETHAYAPELNKVHFENGATLPAANLKTIKEVKDFYFKKPTSIEKHILILSHCERFGERVVARGFMPRAGYRFIKKIIAADRKKRLSDVKYSIKARMGARYSNEPIKGTA